MLLERYFGILQARWAIIRVAAHLFDEEVLRSIMMTCIIIHNMIVEDEYDYDAADVYESNPMTTALTRIYEKPMGPDKSINILIYLFCALRENQLFGGILAQGQLEMKANILTFNL
ncbi:unnamed protein product [Prunus armeniaca]